MRISVIGRQFPDSLARNLSFTLRRMGHVVQEVDQDKLLGLAPLRHRFSRIFALIEMHPVIPAWRERRIQHVLRAFRPDIILNTFAGWHPQAVADSRALFGNTTKFLFLYPDPVANLGREYPLAADYDAWFFKDPIAVERYRTHLDINAHYLPEACNPAWHYPIAISAGDRKRYGCDIATAGNMYYFRARMLEQLVGYDLKIWGSNFPRWLQSPLRAHYPGIYVAETEKAKAFRAAKIIVNTLTHKEVASNARTFEAAGCGAFQIADWRPSMEELFKPDEEIVFFQSRDELKEKVDYYLKRPEARQKIAEAGCRRAHADHTYEKRLERVLQVAEMC